jgi:hypothetical protein
MNKDQQLDPSSESYKKMETSLNEIYKQLAITVDTTEISKSLRSI